MKGLEYVCGIYNMKYTELAEKLNISKQTINSWLTGRRNIPKKHLESSEELFRISWEYFGKEIDNEDKIKIQELKIKNDRLLLGKVSDDNIVVNKEELINVFKCLLKRVDVDYQE